jgi:predicted dienelactone hydrolase
MWRAVSLLALGFSTGAVAATKPQPPQAIARVGVATRMVHPAEARNWRGQETKELSCTVWYPAVDTAVEVKQEVGAPGEEMFEGGMASPRAAFAPSLGKYPLILLSHGSGGSAIQLAWMGQALARAGYIAVAVDHPGNNSGQMTAEGMALWWERATDLSDVLDAMLKDDFFGEHVDGSRVGAAGYSLGGYTMMEIAGAKTDISQYFEMCRQKGDAAVCHTPEARGLGTPQEVLAAARKTSGESLARSGESYRDPRVKAVFAMAPALGFTETQESLHSIRVPMMIVVGDSDQTAPAKDNADYLRANVKTAMESVLPGVTHYTFLDTCTTLGAEKLGRYCTDGPGVSRNMVHERVATMAIGFFDRALRYGGR